MDSIKSIVTIAVAGLTASAGAQAADLPSRKSAPVDYVRTCTINEEFTGFVVPGSDVCLKLGGFVRYNGIYSEPKWTSPGDGRSQNAVVQQAVASVQMDARQTTEYGLLRSFLDVRVGSGLGTSVGIDKAYIQFGGLHAGRVQSLFDFYADDASYGSAVLGSDHNAIALGYTFKFAEGFFAVVSLEDPQGADGTRAAAAFAPYGGNRAPDLVGALGVEQGWGSARLSGAVHQVFTPNPGLGGRTDSEFGYAVQGGAKINVPQIGPSDALFLQAAYADGAVIYLGLPGAAFGNLGGATFASAYDFAYNAAGQIRKTTGWNATATYEHMWNPNWGTNIFGGYTVYDPSRTAANLTFDATGGPFASYKAEVLQVGGNVTWFPVKGLKIGAELTYFDVKLNAPVALASGAFKKSDSVVQGYLRIQRDF